ncbi:MAG TPA: CoA-transferase [Chloroflexota bacterium]|nr:CoA-transferase [Chloroflexota bacterium]
MTVGYSPAEMMIVAAARLLEGERTCFVGVGLPNIACNLARHDKAPDLELIYESGVFGARPARLPLSIGDAALVTGSLSVTSMNELFSYYLQGGLIDVGFLGAAQLDRHGNINTTVIGDYHHPKVRLPGSGGACEIALNARKVHVIMRQSPRSFVSRVDFITSPGRVLDTVVTDLGLYRVEEGEMTLISIHPGVTAGDVQAATGWPLRVAPDLATTPAPAPHELRLIREELDPARVRSVKETVPDLSGSGDCAQDPERGSPHGLRWRPAG